ncbi:aldehyde dehydrogenase family protein [Gordonia sp. (in: high G+C Gram-positive bacteria)]|uniref:aldehyde dehydrogenase family protein n=1 Tax=Gordonia sp. (in: high G+C Gram-positive bacteria) TaxID=84139 RepID=UPI003F96F126
MSFTPSPEVELISTKARLSATFATGRTKSYEWRIRQLAAIERLCEENEPAIAKALADDLGRSDVEAFLGDIASTVGEARYARDHLRSWMPKRSVRLPLLHRPGRAWYQYEPLGVVLVIGPWNYPLGLALGPLVAAVAAGNCAVVKPSEVAPAVSALIAELIPRYLDTEAIVVVEGDAAVTQRLLAEGYDLAIFTGGTEIGRKIMAAAAPTLTPVILELGGKSPVIVAPDADLDIAARRIAWVKLLNSGQTCIAPDYVLAHRSVAADLARRIADYTAQFRSGEPDTSLPIVNQRQFDRLADLISTTTGEIVRGGAAYPDSRRIEMTIIADPAPADPVMKDEIFGPILPIVSMPSTDAAVEFVNDREKPLAVYVFTEDEKAARGIVDRIPSGGAVINHCAMHYLVPQLPFGGVGASGMGAYHGRWGFEAMSHRRPVLSRRTFPDSKMFYPPQSRLAVAIMRRVF